MATGAGLTLLILAAVAWLLFGGGVARGDEKPATPEPTATTPTPTPPAKKPTKKERLAAAAAAAHPPDAVPLDPSAESTLSPRPVRVRLLDGTTVIGTVHAEEVVALIIDCSLGQLSIPRSRISTVAYDAAAGIGQKRAPVQQLDDEDKPTKKRATQP